MSFICFKTHNPPKNAERMLERKYKKIKGTRQGNHELEVELNAGF